VREALASLGYGDEEIREATADLGPDGSTDELLRTALQRLAMVKGR
jgi:Holliday junction resolvasome RuvABC DNA-binding subunit